MKKRSSIQSAVATVLGAPVDTALGLYTYAEFAVCVLSFLPVMAASHALHTGDPTQRKPGRWMRRLGWLTSRLTPLWDFDTEGSAPSDILSKPYIVIANHESTADPFLVSYLPWDMRWVAKEELFKTPVIGLAFQWGGDICLRRGDGESVRAMMNECRQAIDAGIPIMIFPEGTRSKEGELLPFKDGAFQLAIEKKIPILPLAIAGTRECRPKGSKWFGKAKARVRVLEPIETAHLTSADVGALREQSRNAIAKALGELRTSLGLSRKNALTDAVVAAPAPLSP